MHPAQLNTFAAPRAAHTPSPTVGARTRAGWARVPLWLKAAGLVGALYAGLALMPVPAWAGGAVEVGAHFRVQDQAGARDMGLPEYPGAKAYVDAAQPGDKDSVQLSMGLGPFGLQVTVAKYQTPDSPDQVARFYLPALAQYGTVLDCRDPAHRAAATKPADQSLGPKDLEAPVRCDDAAPKGDERSYKVGTERQQRVLAIETEAGQGTVFSLVKVVLKGF